MKKTIFTHFSICVFPNCTRLLKSGLLTIFLFFLSNSIIQAQCPTTFVPIDQPGLTCGELGPNVLANPGFEEGAPGPHIDWQGNPLPPGWFTFGGYGGFPNIFTEVITPRTGDQHIKMFGAFNAPFNVSGFGQSIPTTAGETWAGSIYMMTPGNDAIAGLNNFAEVHIEFFDGNGCFVGGENFKTSEKFDGSTPTDQYIKYEAVATAPAGTVSMNFVAFFFNVDWHPGAVFYDDASLQKVETSYADIAIEVCPGETEADILITEPLYQDDHGIASVFNNILGGSTLSGTYSLGTWPVIFTVEDNDGLTNECSFEIVVSEMPDPLTTLTCNDLIHVSLDENGEAVVSSDVILEGGPYDCEHQYEIVIEDHTGDALPNNIVDCGEIGEDLTASITYLVNGSSCWGKLTVEDKLRPELTNCPDRTIPCTSDITQAPKPSATDNCDNNPTENLISLTQIDDDPCDDNMVKFERVWTAVDDYGNESLPCTDIVSIQRPEPDAVDFPDDITWQCHQYNQRPQIVNATRLRSNITDTEPADDDIDVDPNLTNLNGTGSGVTNVSLGTYCAYEVTHSDFTLASCGETFKIIRTWTILDWCTGMVVTENNQGEDNSQVIDVLDEVAPTIQMDAFEVNANNPGAHPQLCYSTEFLPAANVSDNCSDFTVKIFTPAGEAIYPNGENGNDGGFIPAPGLSYGDHTITYVATDVCGNTFELEVNVTVADLVSPVAICDEITEANLTSDGYAEIFANTFDDGSHDQCCLDYFAIGRMEDACGQGTDFNPTLTLCCEDAANSPITVVFRAYDCDGNFNDCMVQVNVNDKLAPVLISCPPPATITCDFYWDILEAGLALGDISVLDQFGTPEYQDNCELDITQNINDGIDQCGNGNITRTWNAVDPSGNNAVTCTQIIRSNHVSDWVVEFPADLTATCTEDEPVFPEPIVTDRTCEMIATSYEDVIFEVVPDACYKIARQWTVINWCVVGDNVDQEVEEVSEFDLQFISGFPACDLDGDGDCDDRTFRDSWNGSAFPGPANAGTNGAPDTDNDLDPWDGYITYEQVIKVIDDVAPVFGAGCDVPDVCIEDNTCSADVELPIPDISDCSPDVVITQNGDLGAGFSFDDVEPGEYTVIYTVMDNCGNSNACQATFEVSDCKKPTPYCKNGLVIELMVVDPAMVEVWASDFNEGSFDNCTAQEDLKISFSSDTTNQSVTFTCDHIGQQNVEIWITDEVGNQDYCQTFVFIQANMGQCPVDDDPLIAGLIETEDEDPISGVEIQINSPIGFDLNELNNGDGSFEFQVPPGNDYTVTPVKDVDPLNGVSTFDLVLMTKHILGVNLLDSPYKMIAADVNKSGSITTFDLVLLRKLILFIDDNFTNNTSWRFVPKAHTFQNPANPFETQFPEVINLNNLSADVLDNDFIAIKVGDVNGNANLAGDDSENRNSVESLVFQTREQSVKTGETYTVDFTAKDAAVLGYQFTLDFDNEALNFTEVLAGRASSENFGLSLLDEGVITASWHNGEAVSLNSNEVLFSLVFTANTNAQLSDLMNINSSYTVAEGYNADSEILDIELEFLTEETVFELYQNTPNPFSEVTKIGFRLPADSKATLTVSDASGKVVKVVKGDFVKGYNEIELNKNTLGSKGVFYYQLDAENHSATRKMILVK